MSEKVTFIHAADLHLDSPFRGLSSLPDAIYRSVKDSTFTALERLVRVAIERDVDFILLVGDLFDEANRSVRAQIKFKEACEKLREHHIEVFVSYGNHDYVDKDVEVITYPDNVYVFPPGRVTSKTFCKKHMPLANIYGFSYDKRAVTENKVSEYELIDASIPFHIAMLHGAVNDVTDHPLYAPFRVSELRATPFHYWALGHVHERTILSNTPPIIYPGNIQGRHRKELGERGCFYVEMTKAETSFKFIPLQSVLFAHTSIDITDCHTIFAVEEKLKNKFQQIKGKTLMSLTFYDRKLSSVPLQKDMLDELVATINEREQERTDWIYLYRYDVQTERKPHRIQDDTFIQELNEVFNELSLSEITQDITTHPLGRKFLTDVANEEHLLDEARTYLFDELGRLEEGE